MPNRIIRDGILDSRAIDKLSEQAELLYKRLINVVDDYGRCEADLDVLQVRVFPRPNRRAQWPIPRLMEALSEACQCQTDDGHSLVIVYHVAGKQYLQLNNFKQRVRAEKSKCPDPPTTYERHDQTEVAKCLPDDGHLRASRARTTPTSSSTPTVFVSSDKENCSGSEIPLVAETLKVLPSAENGVNRFGFVEDLDGASDAIEEILNRIAARHPITRGIALGKSLLRIAAMDKTDPVGFLVGVDRKHALFCDTPGWRDRPKHLDNWVKDLGYDDPDPKPPPIPDARLSDRELRIRRVRENIREEGH